MQETAVKVPRKCHLVVERKFCRAVALVISHRDAEMSPTVMLDVP